MIAVIKTGGKQYIVKEGQSLKVEKLLAEANAKHVFDEVLLVADEAGQNVKVGAPYVPGAKVETMVTSQGRAKKIEIVKFKAKVRYRRHGGHRQMYTELKIGKITT